MVSGGEFVPRPPNQGPFYNLGQWGNLIFGVSFFINIVFVFWHLFRRR